MNTTITREGTFPAEIDVAQVCKWAIISIKKAEGWKHTFWFRCGEAQAGNIGERLIAADYPDAQLLKEMVDGAFVSLYKFRGSSTIADVYGRLPDDATKLTEVLI